MLYIFHLLFFKRHEQTLQPISFILSHQKTSHAILRYARRPYSKSVCPLLFHFPIPLYLDPYPHLSSITFSIKSRRGIYVERSWNIGQFSRRMTDDYLRDVKVINWALEIRTSLFDRIVMCVLDKIFCC